MTEYRAPALSRGLAVLEHLSQVGVPMPDERDCRKPQSLF